MNSDCLVRRELTNDALERTMIVITRRTRCCSATHTRLAAIDGAAFTNPS